MKTKMLSVRTTEDVFLAVQNLARFQGQSVSDFILNAIYEKIEDWEDLKAVEEYREAKAQGKVTYVSWEQVQKDAGL